MARLQEKMCKKIKNKKKSGWGGGRGGEAGGGGGGRRKDLSLKNNSSVEVSLVLSMGMEKLKIYLLFKKKKIYI